MRQRGGETSAVREYAAIFLGTLAGGAGAALVLAGIDLVQIARSPGVSATAAARAGGLLAAEALSVGLVAGLGLALLVSAWSLAQRILGTRLGRLAALIVLTTALFPLVRHAAETLLSGPRISRHPRIDLIRAVAPLAGAFAAACALALVAATLRRSRRFGGVAVAGIVLFAAAAGLACDRIDRTAYRGQYPIAHDACALGALIALTSAWGLVLARRRARRLVLATVVACGLAAASTHQILRTEPSETTRYLLERRTLNGPRLERIRRHLTKARRSATTTVARDRAFAARRAQRAARSAATRARLDAALPDRDDWNLLWITIDTLRADHLSCYGYDRPTTPHIDELASRSTRFEHAYAQFSITHFSFQSMFYGRYPTATPLYRRLQREPDDPNGSRTVAELLTAQGFATACVPAIPAYSLDHPTYEVMARGFTDVNPHRGDDASLRAPTQTRCAIAWLREHRDRRAFLWLHLMDPHHPYVKDPAADFGDDAVARYDSEITVADAAVGRVLDVLEDLDLARKTVIVVHSDHGEAFGEHDSTFHGSTLYDEQIRVPMIIHVPGLDAHAVEAPAENVDIMPTVFDLLGLELNQPHQGESLVAHLLEGDAAPDPPDPVAYAELPDAIPQLSPAASNREAIVEGRWKLIHDRTAGIRELYDLIDDPAESRNRAAEHRDVAARLAGMIETLRAESRAINRPETSETGPVDVAARLREQLRGKPVHVKNRLLRAALAKYNVALGPLVSALIADPSLHPSTRTTLLRDAAEVLGDELPRLALHEITRGASFGAVVAAIDALARHSPEALRRPEATSRLRELLRAPAPVARRAAGALTRIDDDSGRDALLAALASPEITVAVDAACDLARIDDATGCPILIDALPALARDPRRCAAAIDALRVQGIDAAAEAVEQLVRDRYLHHEIKEAAARYFAAAPIERAVIGFLDLLNGWDPRLTRDVRTALERRTGTDHAKRLVAAARTWNDAWDLVSQGRFGTAAASLESTVTAIGDDRSAVTALVWAARMHHAAGDVARAQRLAARAYAVAEDRWIPAHHPILPSNGGGTARLVAESFSSLAARPWAPSRSERFLIRLRHESGPPVLGGAWPHALGLRIAWEAAGVTKTMRLPPGRLLDEGLAPGETRSLVLEAHLPESPGTYLARLNATTTANGAVDLTEKTSAIISIPGDGARGGVGIPARWTGAELRRAWRPIERRADVAAEANGALSVLVHALDPTLLGPLIQSSPAAARITIDATAHAPLPGRRVAFEIYWSYDDTTPFETKNRAVVEIPADGSRHTLEIRLPERGGRGPRRMRIDPGELTDLVVIREITLESR